MPCPKLSQDYKPLHSSSIASEFEEEARLNAHFYPPQNYELVIFQTSNV